MKNQLRQTFTQRTRGHSNLTLTATLGPTRDFLACKGCLYGGRIVAEVLVVVNRVLEECHESVFRLSEYTL